MKYISEYDNYGSFFNLSRLEKIANFNNDLIKEGFIFSYEYNRFKLMLEKLFDDKYMSALEVKLTNHFVEANIRFMRTVNKNGRKDFYDKLISLLNVSGYQVSNWISNGKLNRVLSLQNLMNNDDFTIHFNKRFDFLDQGIKITMYHVTKDTNLQKISRIGLVPKSNNSIEGHPERIYLFDNIDIAEFYKNEKGEDYTILKIDMRLLKKVKLYKDPKFDEIHGAYYTYDNITPIAISSYE